MNGQKQQKARPCLSKYHATAAASLRDISIQRIVSGMIRDILTSMALLVLSALTLQRRQRKCMSRAKTYAP